MQQFTEGSPGWHSAAAHPAAKPPNKAAKHASSVGFVRLMSPMMGPEAIPVILDEQVAREDPELAVLSAMAHGHEEVGASIAHTVLAAVAGLDAERVRCPSLP